MLCLSLWICVCICICICICAVFEPPVWTFVFVFLIVDSWPFCHKHGVFFVCFLLFAEDSVTWYVCKRDIGGEYAYFPAVLFFCICLSTMINTEISWVGQSYQEAMVDDGVHQEHFSPPPPPRPMAIAFISRICEPSQKLFIAWVSQNPFLSFEGVVYIIVGWPSRFPSMSFYICLAERGITPAMKRSNCLGLDNLTGMTYPWVGFELYLHMFGLELKLHLVCNLLGDDLSSRLGSVCPLKQSQPPYCGRT